VYIDKVVIKTLKASLFCKFVLILEVAAKRKASKHMKKLNSVFSHLFKKVTTLYLYTCDYWVGIQKEGQAHLSVAARSIGYLKVFKEHKELDTNHQKENIVAKNEQFGSENRYPM
jgi:hypothetical protein